MTNALRELAAARAELGFDPIVLICQRCAGSGWIEVELDPGPGEYHDPSGRREVRCPVCNWRPGDDEPDEVAEAMDAAMDAEIDSEVEEAWGIYDERQRVQAKARA